MQIKVTDFNEAGEILASPSLTDWADIAAVLSELPLHLKASDQAGKKGTPIFDAVGTNQGIKDGLLSRGWKAGLAIPDQYRFLGTDVDFAKNEVIAEVQFSNYPFLLNNTIRSELFYRADLRFTHSIVRVVVIVTKAWMFPSSNSTLYYEQAAKQLSELHRNRIFNVPIRLVGLFAPMGQSTAMWTEYSDPRYSRTVTARKSARIEIRTGKTSRSRPRIVVERSIE